MKDPYGNPIVEWPKHYKPLPEGYYVVFVDDHYKWVNDELDTEGKYSGDRYWARRCAFAHYTEDVTARLQAAEAEVERIKGQLSNQECDTAFWKARCEKVEGEAEEMRKELDGLEQLAEFHCSVDGELEAERDALKAEVERLEAVVAQEINRYSSLVRHAGEIKSTNVDLKSEVERLKAEVNDMAFRLGYAEHEAMRLKAHIWEQERVAVVAWLRDTINDPTRDRLAERIEKGEHWPEGETL